ncbi:TraR/DksA family transcriptional regulator [Sphaerisporangium perillae]|uniref:TraR/DksA family transcriptional regulator n=1 Tax=Sphaerisporangium perillae TaxID=2935860 RepID=UPI00200FD821|nr:hypothetical protein [Sphaerisporangium perillae]
MADIRSVNTLMQDYQRHVAQLERLRALLQERLGAAEAEFDRLGERLLANEPTTSRRALVERARRARVTVVKMRAAIVRMDRGLYGTCRRCGTFIPLDQLLRAPHIQECATCRNAHVDRVAV